MTDRVALVVIDVPQAFFTPGRPAYYPASTEVLGPLRELLARARADRRLVVPASNGTGPASPTSNTASFPCTARSATISPLTCAASSRTARTARSRCPAAIRRPMSDPRGVGGGTVDAAPRSVSLASPDSPPPQQDLSATGEASSFPPRIEYSWSRDTPHAVQAIAATAALPLAFAVTSVKVLKNFEELLGELTHHLRALRPASEAASRTADQIQLRRHHRIRMGTDQRGARGDHPGGRNR
jgi:hypothetical protein